MGYLFNSIKRIEESDKLTEFEKVVLCKAYIYKLEEYINAGHTMQNADRQAQFDILSTVIDYVDVN